MHSLKHLARLSLAVVLTNTTPLRAADNDDKPEPITAAQALKLGVEGLAEKLGPSEIDQDEAARLYATAKRLETEQALAKKNLKLVTELEDWRSYLESCRGHAYTMAYVVNGGGTMYTHGHARDCAEVEDFLATLAKRLPLAEGKGDPKASKQITDSIAFLKKLKPYDSGDAKADKTAKAELATQFKAAEEHWTNLRYAIEAIPAEDAKKIAEFVVDSLGWLKEGEEK